MHFAQENGKGHLRGGREATCRDDTLLEYLRCRIHQRKCFYLGWNLEIRPELRLEGLERFQRRRVLLRFGSILMDEVHECAAVLLEVDSIFDLVIADRAQLASRPRCCVCSARRIRVARYIGLGSLSRSVSYRSLMHNGLRRSR